ncbi:MAG: TrmH family RNA methyltransferase [Candidatus Nomurabacteria bacterium]|nr:MAG: TrmH family RNA methyltransferase [Candidatus Nomurabacteria bacterium]HRV76042.1 TrmH family RNA methyltransferase [Candidatus Saccharimonadales bacterium]
MKELAVVLNNVRSCENVGSILRTADFFGFEYVWFVGVTPYPTLENDQRLPHIREKLDKQIKKVSLGAEKNLTMIHESSLEVAVNKLKDMGWNIIGLEQNSKSVDISRYKFKSKKNVVVLGTEVTGLDFDDLSLVDEIVEIPRYGKKESLNVSVAFGIVASQASGSFK